MNTHLPSGSYVPGISLRPLLPWLLMASALSITMMVLGAGRGDHFPASAIGRPAGGAGGRHRSRHQRAALVAQRQLPVALCRPRRRARSHSLQHLARRPRLRLGRVGPVRRLLALGSDVAPCLSVRHRRRRVRRLARFVRAAARPASAPCRCRPFCSRSRTASPSPWRPSLHDRHRQTRHGQGRLGGQRSVPVGRRRDLRALRDVGRHADAHHSFRN